MSLGTILIIALVVLLITSLPTWRHSRDWGYVPSSVLTIAFVVVVVMLITGNL